MSTRIEIDYDRKHADADVNAVLARTIASIGVLKQLGTAYQNLPDLALADYETKSESLADKIQALDAHLTAIKDLLPDIDNAVSELIAMNIALLRALQGLLKGKTEISKLDQITGPTPQTHSTTTTTQS